MQIGTEDGQANYIRQQSHGDSFSDTRSINYIHYLQKVRAVKEEYYVILLDRLNYRKKRLHLEQDK